jgi:hypothetical protein
MSFNVNNFLYNKETETNIVVYQDYKMVEGTWCTKCSGCKDCDFTGCYCNDGDFTQEYDVKWTMINVLGNPITTKPHDSAYLVKVYEDRVFKNDVDIPLYNSENYVWFIVYNSLELDENMKKNITQCHLHEKHFKSFGNPKFQKAQASLESYIDAFESIVRNVYRSKTEETKKENPHVGKKKKNKK